MTPAPGNGYDPWSVDRDIAAVHAWARGLPWWLHVLLSPWLPSYPPPVDRGDGRNRFDDCTGTGGVLELEQD